MNHSAVRQSSERCSNLVRIAALAVCVCGPSMSALADGSKLGGVELWVSTADAAPTALNGSSLLRPPASWAWDAPTPVLDFAAGIGHQFLGGVSLDAGVSVAHVPEYPTTALSGQLPENTINYRDYFLGLSLGALDGKVWYLPESSLGGESSAVYYEAGWAQPVTDKLSLSVRLGQYEDSSPNRLLGTDDMPSLSLGASTSLDGYGLGLRLIDSGGRMFGGEQDLQLMGSISKPLH